jgi:hypothetical protein
MLKFFLDTRLGQSLLLAGGITLAIGLTYWWVSSSAYDRGYAACQAEHAKAVDDANRTQAKTEDAQRQGATQIAKAADASAQAATRAADEATHMTQGVITDVYREPPKTNPVVFGACVQLHPVDGRVQQRIDEAVDSANRP